MDTDAGAVGLGAAWEVDEAGPVDSGGRSAGSSGAASRDSGGTPGTATSRTASRSSSRNCATHPTSDQSACSIAAGLASFHASGGMPPRCVEHVEQPLDGFGCRDVPVGSRLAQVRAVLVEVAPDLAPPRHHRAPVLRRPDRLVVGEVEQARRRPTERIDGPFVHPRPQGGRLAARLVEQHLARDPLHRPSSPAGIAVASARAASQLRDATRRAGGRDVVELGVEPAVTDDRGPRRVRLEVLDPEPLRERLERVAGGGLLGGGHPGMLAALPATVSAGTARSPPPGRGRAPA